MYLETQAQPFITGAIISGDALGGLMTFPLGGAHSAGRLRQVVLADDDNQITPMELWLFRNAPTGAVSGAVWDVTDADLNNLLGVVPIPSGSFYRDNDSAIGVVKDLDLPLIVPGGTMYGRLVARGAYSQVTGTAIDVRLQIEV